MGSRESKTTRVMLRRTGSNQMGRGQKQQGFGENWREENSSAPGTPKVLLISGDWTLKVVMRRQDELTMNRIGLELDARSL